MKMSCSASAMNVPFRSYMAATALATLPSVFNHVYLGHVRTICATLALATLKALPIQCNTLQHTATHCNTLHGCNCTCNTKGIAYTMQHTATHCNTLQPCVSRTRTYCFCVYALYLCSRHACPYLHENVCVSLPSVLKHVYLWVMALYIHESWLFINMSHVYIHSHV